MNISWFSKLKLSAKLQTATFLLIVTLSIFGFFYFNIQSQIQLQNNQISEIQKLNTSAAKYLTTISEFLNENATMDSLAAARKKFEGNSNVTTIKEIKQIEENFSKGASLIKRNKELFAEVEKLTEDSIVTSNKFITETSARLS